MDYKAQLEFDTSTTLFSISTTTIMTAICKIIFTKSGAKYAGTYLYEERSESCSNLDLVSYSPLVATYTVAIVANCAKVADFHCRPYQSNCMLLCHW